MNVINPPPPVGFNKFVGLKLIEWDVGHACVALDIDERHLNGLDVIHGGVLLSALDYACGMSGCYRPPPRERQFCMTLSPTTNFVSALRDGKLRAKARRIGGGKAVFFSEGEIIDANGTLIATASGTFRLLRDNPSSQESGSTV